MNEVPPVNPFQTPVSSERSAENRSGNEQTALLLRQTRPWTITIGIFLAIGAAMAMVGGLGLAAMSLFVGAGGAPGMPNWFGFVFGPMYILFGALYVIPAVMLFKYSSRISKYMTSPTTECLNSALAAQKSFWKFCGIAAIGMVVLYFFMIIVMLIIGVVAGPTGFSS